MWIALTRTNSHKANNAARVIQGLTRGFILRRKLKSITSSKPRAKIPINLYDAAFDLSDKKDRKLFEAVTKGLSEDLKLTREKESAWEDSKVVSPKNPIEIKNIFNKTGLKEDQIEAQ
eukprot:12760748-Ditylum_brightwellii.AAC.1